MTATVERTERAEASEQTRWPPSLGEVWAVLAVGLAVALTEGSLRTVDLAYNLRAGEIMLHTHHLIRTDTFTFTAQGHPWTDQQWLAQLLFGFVFQHLGWAGLALLAGVLVGAIFLLVYLAARAAGVEGRAAAWLTLVAFAVAVWDSALRPQLIAAAFFGATLWIVTGRRRHPRRLWAVPAIVALWANVHGTFPLGPLVLLLGWIEDRSEHAPDASRTGLVTVISVAATFLNPFGLRVWSYVVDVSTNPTIRKTVAEWQPPSIRHFGDALFFASLAAVAVLLARRGRPAPWTKLAGLGVFALFGLFAARNTLWWALAAPVLVAGIIHGRGAASDGGSPRSHLNTLLVALIGASIVVAFPWSLVGRPTDDPGSRVSFAPRGITTTLERVLPPGTRIYNAQEWGSWFELSLPRDPVFVDARIEVFPRSVWLDYNAVAAGREGWQAILRRWNVDAVVLADDQQPALIPIIRRDPGWRLVYQDAVGSVYVPAASSTP
jgi:hypothetical protein